MVKLHLFQSIQIEKLTHFLLFVSFLVYLLKYCFYINFLLLLLFVLDSCSLVRDYFPNKNKLLLCPQNITLDLPFTANCDQKLTFDFSFLPNLVAMSASCRFGRGQKMLLGPYFSVIAILRHHIILDVDGPRLESKILD